MKKAIVAALAGVLALVGVAGCKTKADVASENLSKAADNFEIFRQIVFINGITDSYLEEIDGYCSLGNSDKPGELSVTCKQPDGSFTKDFVGLSDNVTYVVHQVDGANVSTSHYRVVFKPETIVPDIRVGG